jgi:redox-sensitive bicupin YhaK (pirin superfamily)
MHPIALGHNAFVYPYEGQLKIGLGTEKQIPTTHRAGLLSEGDHLAIQADDEDLAVLLLTAKTRHEPIVQSGPLVMNTHEEIEQAIADYRNGGLVSQD